MQALRHYLLAVQFFTRIPSRGGWLRGWVTARTCCAPARRIFRRWLAGGSPSCAVALLAPGLGRSSRWHPGGCGAVHGNTVLMTGGFHEDGLADVADGLGGSYDRERALDIMKDSRIGALWRHGPGAGAAGQGQPAGAAGRAQPGAALAALAGACASRLWPLFIVRWLPHVGDTARSKANHWPIRFHAARWRRQFCGVFASGACLSSAISYVFNSIHHRQCWRLPPGWGAGLRRCKALRVTAWAPPSRWAKSVLPGCRPGLGAAR